VADEDEIDHLFELSPSEFVAARNALAKKLSGSGDKAKGLEVKALAKPSASAFALNQLARKHARALAVYFEVSDRLFRAQVRAMAAGGADPDFRPAQEAQRDALNDLISRLGSVPRAVEERVAATLRAAVLDEAARARLKAGRMTEDLAEAGFDALAVQLGTAPVPPPEPVPAAQPAPAAAPARAQIKEAEQRAQASKKASIEAARAVEPKRRLVETAKRDVSAAKTAFEAAEAALREAEFALAAAESEASARAEEARADEEALSLLRAR
jgi:hypothetical protein